MEPLRLVSKPELAEVAAVFAAGGYVMHMLLLASYVAIVTVMSLVARWQILGN